MHKAILLLLLIVCASFDASAQKNDSAEVPATEINTDFNPQLLSGGQENAPSVRAVEPETRPIDELIPYPMNQTKGLIEACQQVLAAERGDAYDLRGYGLCEGYMRGVKNTYDMQQQFGSEGRLCFPSDITWIDLIRTFMRWSEIRRAERNQLAWVSLITAFSRAYPCP